MADSDDITYSNAATRTVLILLFCLLGLLVLLFFLYKKLNREANGEYTVRRMVYKEGGVRDRVRGAALALGTRLGVQLWPQSDTDEDGEEMQEVQDEEGQVEEGGSQGSDSEGDDQEDEEEEEEEEEECGGAKGEGGDIRDNSSVESLEAEEQDRLMDQAEAEGQTGEKVGDGEGTGEAKGGAGLVIDLKHFSGSAIWSEEKGDMAIDSDVTAL
ncbi:YTH domain-containing protein 1 [Cebidichthys violaceus]|uniref:YTH domain-containing protein 1 n=1 Tax=Cebidichthys violaceus TaxID=271503 RepID=UPI0035CACC08